MGNHADDQSFDKRDSELVRPLNRITYMLQQQHKLYQHQIRYKKSITLWMSNECVLMRDF